MRHLLLALLLFPLVAMAAPAAPAVSAAKQALAQQYFEVSGTDKMFTDKEQVGKMMDSQLKMVAQGAQQNMPPQEFARFQQVMAKVRPNMDASVAQALKQMRPELVQVIATRYSEQELTALIAFYKTPEGRSVVAKNPEVMSAMMEVAGKQTAVMIQQLQQSLIQALQESSAASKQGPAGK